MPPQPSLPSRDGRVGLPLSSSSSSSASKLDDQPPQPQKHIQSHQHHHLQPANSNEPYYSDEEIGLLYDIVVLAESILPTLPEQNRLPTEALFSAAEQILPGHGYDPDRLPPHLSRLIFKIGGHRSGDTLRDKFRSILEGMGIKLDYIPTSPARTETGTASSSAPSPIVVSRRTGARPRLSPADEGEEADDAYLDLPIHGRAPSLGRRHSSSVSRPTTGGGGGQQFNLPIRPVPTTGSGAGAGAGDDAQPRPRSLSLTDYDSDAALKDALLSGRKETGIEGEKKGVHQHKQAATEHERPINPVLRAAHALTRITSQDYHPQEEDEDEPDDTTPELPILPFQTHVPVMERARKPSDGFVMAHDNADLSEPEARDVSTIGDTDFVHHSPRTEATDPLFRGDSDPTGQTPSDPYPYHIEAADLELLEGRLHHFRVRDREKLIQKSLATWRFNAVITRRDNEQHQRRAKDWDDLDMLAEVLDIWNEEAILAQEERVEAQVSAEHEAYVAKMEKRAQRVYEILTIRDVLSYWQDCAQDEVDRTAVARRHLVRKRAFDSWRAQHIEDETKVKNFVLINALQKWSQVALLHEVRYRVSGQRYANTLAESGIRAMWEGLKGRIADNFRWFKLADECISVWYNRTREVQAEMEVAEAGDNRLVLCEVLDIWHEETEESQYTAYEGSMQLLTQECIRNLEYWHEQARLNRLLKQSRASQLTSLAHRVLNSWHQSSLQLSRNALRANALLLDDPLAHWTRQTKLQLFYSHNDHRTKSELLHTWYLEERLAWYKRRIENQTQIQALNTLLATTRRARSDRVRSTQEADYEYTYFSQFEVVEMWRAAAEATWKPRHNANLILLYRTTMPVLEVWRKHHKITVARASHDRLAADRCAKRSILSTVLAKWPKVAERVKRERLLIALREFRRNYKLELAEGCLEKWWLGTRDSLEMGRNEADALLLDHKREDILGMLEYWEAKAAENRNVRVIAEEAELEVWCGVWLGKLEDVDNLRELAERLDADETVKRCWARLEFQSLQRQGLKNTVAAVREKNDRRLCGRVLDEWLENAIPSQADETMDPRFSTMLRRNFRQQRDTPSGARSTLVAGMGRPGGGHHNDNRNVFTPASSVVGGGFQRGGGRATTTAHRVYTGGGGGGGGASNTFATPQTFQQQPPLPSVSRLGMPANSTSQRPRQRGGFNTTITTDNKRPLAFGSSVATPAQPIPAPMPMTEFDIDEEEDSLLVSLTGRNNEEGDGGDDSDGPPPDLGFMSTPSRRLSRPGQRGGGGSRQQQQQPPPPRHRALASLAAATTTPSAILASPYERELRRVYGQTAPLGLSQSLSRGAADGGQAAQGLGLALGLGMGQSLARGERAREREREREAGRESQRDQQGGGGGRPGRVVEFADIREESAEL